MKKIFKIFFFISVFSLILNFTQTAYADMEISDVKNGVIRILTDDGMYSYQGSGFAIGKQGEPVSYIVTNYHVVQDMININLYFEEDKQYPLEVTDIVFRDNDIALVKLSEPLDIQPLILETVDTGETGDKIYALGFPALADSLDETFTGYPEDITVTSGIISKISEINNSKFYQIDAAISGGNSGGPLINEKGYVIGINSFGVVNDDGSPVAGYNGSYMLNRLIRELDKNDIPYTSSKDIEKESESEDNTKKDEISKAASKPQKDGDAVEVSDQKTSQNSIPYVPIIIGGAFLLVVIIIVIAVSAKGRKQKVPQQQMVPPVINVIEKPVEKRPQIVGVTGYQAGRIYPVEGIMTFGRNPASKVPYPENYKGISGNHCILQYDSNNELFIISDMGSSYGTFLENGQMIQKNSKVALSSGDKFYLADAKEMFEVRIS